MKKLTILLFSILISFGSYGEWTHVITNDGVDFYVDTDSYKKHNEGVYWWEMKSFPKPINNNRSVTLYKQGECGINRYKLLSLNAYTKPMAKGERKALGGSSEWDYPEPRSIPWFNLNAACGHAK